MRRGLGWGCMQYKIPVQIENEDPIFWTLSLRQLIIILVWGTLGYSIFNGLAPNVWPEVAALPWIFITVLFIIIAIFKNHEMTFVPFILALIRYKINYSDRKWQKWDDSMSALQVWFVPQTDIKKTQTIDFESKMHKIKNIDDKLEKLK